MNGTQNEELVAGLILLAIIAARNVQQILTWLLETLRRRNGNGSASNQVQCRLTPEHIQSLQLTGDRMTAAVTRVETAVGKLDEGVHALNTNVKVILDRTQRQP